MNVMWWGWLSCCLSYTAHPLIKFRRKEKKKDTGYTMMPARIGSNHCLYLSETCHVILYVVTSTNNNNILQASYWFEAEEGGGEVMWLLSIAAKRKGGRGVCAEIKDHGREKKVYYYHLNVWCSWRKFWYMILDLIS